MKNKIKMYKILIVFLFLFIANIGFSQTTYWLSNPNIIGKLTFSNGWTLYDTTTGIKIPTNFYIMGSELYLGVGTILKDSSGYIISNQPFRFRADDGQNVDPWIKTEYIIDSSISKEKIKPGTITTEELAPTTRDSIFGAKNLGNLDRNLTTLKTRYDLLFKSNGDFKPSVFDDIVTYDTTLKKIVIDTTFFLTKNDSVNFLTSTNFDTAGIIREDALNPLYFTINSEQVSLQNFSIPANKIDSSIFYNGIKYNPMTDKIELTTKNDSLYSGQDSTGAGFVIRPHDFLRWTMVFSSSTDQWVQRYPGSIPDSVGIGMPKPGYFVNFTIDDQGTRDMYLSPIRDGDNNLFEFNTRDFISIKYEDYGEASIYKNGVLLAGPFPMSPAIGFYTTFTIEVAYTE